MFRPLPQPAETASVRALLANTKTLQQILTEAHALLRMFWRAALPGSDRCSQDNKQVATPHGGYAERDSVLPEGTLIHLIRLNIAR